MAEIKIIEYSKKYSSNLIFDKISFNIEVNSVVSIVGPSGSGKSTILRSIIGLDRDFSGEILIGSSSSSEYLSKERIAFVQQRYSNFHWLNVYDNIAEAFYNKNIGSKKKKEIILNILEEVDLLGFETYYTNQLSGGMQQRVAVARALVQDTEIIAMDEPFGALDMKIRINLQLLIKELNIKHKKTIIFVTHDIEEAIFLSDKIIVLSKPPINKIRIYDKDRLYFKTDLDPYVKHKNEFIALRREIEDFIIKT